MPYYLHAIGSDISSGIAYDTKPLALADRVDGQTVSFIASDDEREAWQMRETTRFADGTYVDVPWKSSDGYYTHNLFRHYAHISIKTPGKIAYTPDDMYGVSDRQVTVKPGKYLTEFMPGISAAKLDEYCAAVSAFSEPLKLARTTEEVIQAYTSGTPEGYRGQHSPTSCMSYPADSSHYDTGGVHPVSVYGESDLAIAYLGVLGERVTARCVVWPDKKFYFRIYGDLTLEAILKTAGYTNNGSLNGARVRKIAVPGRYSYRFVMPYVDWYEYAESNGQWFILSNSHGSYSTQNTNGVTSEEEEEEERNYCSREDCGNECDEGESYCDSCNDDRWMCDGCNEDYFDNDDRNILGDYSFCPSCVPCTEECQICSSEWREHQSRRYDMDGDQIMTRDEVRAHNARGMSALCEECADSHVVCPHCEEFSEKDTDDDICSSCDEPMRELVTAEVLEEMIYA